VVPVGRTSAGPPDDEGVPKGQRRVTPPRWVRRVLVREGLWVVGGTLDYGGGREDDFVLILELRDGKVFRETRNYADPFEASDARARWFERMER
jgi:hypothetical protein